MTCPGSMRLGVLHDATIHAFLVLPFPKGTDVIFGGCLSLHTVSRVGQGTTGFHEGWQQLAENSAQKASQLVVTRFFVKSGEIRLEYRGLDFHALEHVVVLRLCHQNAPRHAIGGGELSQGHVFDQSRPDYSARAQEELWVVFVDHERDLCAEKSIADMLSRRYGGKSEGERAERGEDQRTSVLVEAVLADIPRDAHSCEACNARDSQMHGRGRRCTTDG